MKFKDYLELHSSKRLQIAKKAASLQDRCYSNLYTKYLTVYDRLRKMKPIESDFILRLEPCRKEVRVFGVKPIEHVALGFTKWEMWLGSEIESPFQPIKTIANCLYEMTFNGFDQRKIQGKYRHLLNVIRKIKS